MKLHVLLLGIATNWFLQNPEVAMSQISPKFVLDARLAQIDSFSKGLVTYVKLFKPLYEDFELDTLTYGFERKNGRTVKFCLIPQNDSLSFVAKDSQYVVINHQARTYRKSKIDALEALSRLVTRLPSTFVHKLNPARELLQDARTVVDTSTILRNGEALYAITYRLQTPSPEDPDYLLRQVTYYIDSTGAVRGDLTVDSLWGSSLIQGSWIVKFSQTDSVGHEIDRLYRTISDLREAPPFPKRNKLLPRATIENGVRVGPLLAQDSQGLHVTLESFSGKVRMLFFWYAGCGPCHQLRPLLIDLQKRYSEQVEIIGLNPIDSLPVFRRAIQSQHYNYLNLSSLGVADSIGVTAYPTTLVLDQTGKIVWHARGLPKDLPSKLEAALVAAISLRN